MTEKKGRKEKSKTCTGKFLKRQFLRRGKKFIIRDTFEFKGEDLSKIHFACT